LADASIITPQELSHILSLLPKDTSLRALVRDGTSAPMRTLPSPAPVEQLERTSLNEKQNSLAPTPPRVPPPPAYASSPPPLATATALYSYNALEEGDLALHPNDNISVLEYTNGEWWRGRNERTGLEGIFPSTYVRVIEDKQKSAAATNYGNIPLQVSQEGAPPSQESGGHSKLGENGKKFGKKMGNAAIFGAVSAPQINVNRLRNSNTGQGRYRRIKNRQQHFLDTFLVFHPLPSLFHPLFGPPVVFGTGRRSF
jgi:LAS seventeen-binding protein 1/2